MKEEIIKQIKAELLAQQQEEQNKQDAAHYTALAAYYTALAKGIKTPRVIASETKKSQPNIQKELSKRLKAISGLPLNTPKENKIPEFKKTYEVLEKYISAFPTQKNIVFIGAAGTGKTHAAQTICTRLLDKGFSVIFTTAFTLIQRFKDYIFSYEYAALSHLLTCDLLVIDDLGTEPKIKNISDEYLLNVINERMANEKPFILTTNLSPDDIMARYDQRLTSRILSKQTSVVIEMKGKDLRLS